MDQVAANDKVVPEGSDMIGATFLGLDERVEYGINKILHCIQLEKKEEK